MDEKVRQQLVDDHFLFMSGDPNLKVNVEIRNLKAVPKMKIRINLSGRSALLREYIFFDVQFVI